MAAAENISSDEVKTKSARLKARYGNSRSKGNTSSLPAVVRNRDRRVIWARALSLYLSIAGALDEAARGNDSKLALDVRRAGKIARCFSIKIEY